MADTSGSSSTTYAFMATLLISAAPSVLLCAIPSKAMHQHTYGVSINRVMLAFAASSLLSDVFLHMSPFLFGAHTHGPQETCPAPCLHGEHDHDRDPHDAHGHDHDHDHDHDHAEGGHTHGHEDLGASPMLVGICMLAGFFLFFFVERVLALTVTPAGPLDGAAVAAAAVPDPDSEAHGHPDRGQLKRRGSGRHPSAPVCGDGAGAAHVGAGVAAMAAAVGPANGAAVDKAISHGHHHQAHADANSSVICWLNVSGDLMHNLTDGLAIGSAFASGDMPLAISTTVSVLVHELPHELADYAVLVQNGFSKMQAIFTQALTAVGAFAGTLLGLMAKRNATAEAVLLSITAGGFIYVAAVTVLPSLHADLPPGTRPVLQTCCEAVAVAVGVLLMVAVAYME